MLKKIFEVLKTPAEALHIFEKKKAMNVIANTYSFQDNAAASGFLYQPPSNPVDKIAEFYEAILQQQNAMIEKIEKLINK